MRKWLDPTTLAYARSQNPGMEYTWCQWTADRTNSKRDQEWVGR